MGVGWSEMALLALLGVVLFGKDLPRVARDCGRFIAQLRRSLSDIF